MLHWLGKNHSELPLIMSIPHSGEVIPEEATWLRGLPERLLLTDVDRFVDQLYTRAVTELSVPALMTHVHRYAADLNRYPGDVDGGSVVGSLNEAGTFSKGFHWVFTTKGEQIMHSPIPLDLHERIVQQYHDRFHEEFGAKLDELRGRFPSGSIFHLDCHSMPSTGTGAHADQGEKRPDVVISDFDGKSASVGFKNCVVDAFTAEGWQVGYNWPYKGGRITQRYGQPLKGHETIQIELNRALYMDEGTREKLPGFDSVCDELKSVLARIIGGLKKV